MSVSNSKLEATGRHHFNIATGLQFEDIKPYKLCLPLQLSSKAAFDSRLGFKLQSMLEIG